MWKYYMTSVATVGMAATCMHVWATVSFHEYEGELARCRGDAIEANEHRHQLLSHGRFVRQYDSATNRSIYTFDTKWHRQ